ncbi:S53 family peptidase [Streptomyces sp. NBC_00536]|uniref:S53 family peptidase n=1 Tax=Streptomyces sp. NBC_00536 TaxID=2975769 RepID=UPI002E80B0BC|nr:S53 family peptidase [Streptomyces sp. NBC_00536]WUC81762.1 S53 family peptidase [Streptomyces sp. NBC_00536]
MSPSSPHVRIRPRTLAAAVCAALLGTALAGPAAHADSPAEQRHILPGSHPGYATASADTGPVPAEERLTARLHLDSRDPAGLAAFIKGVSDPHSPSYRHFLTPDQYRRRFDLSPQEHRALARWLTGAGLTVTRDTPHYLEISGPAKAVQQALGSPVHRYRTPRGTVSAPSGDVSVPGALGADIVAVSGLSAPAAVRPLSSRTTGPVSTPADAPTGAPAVCSDHFGQKPAADLPPAYGRTTAYSPCPYVPAQLRRAYGAGGAGATGKGATIAIVDAYGSPTMPADADRFAKATGDRPFRLGQYRQQVTPKDWNLSPACAPPASWAGEQALDVDMAHGLAPDADVLYVGANSCLDDDLMDAEAAVIDGHLADSVSNSWAEIVHSEPGHLTPDLVNAWNLLFQQAAAEGIGIYFAAGDCGDSSPGAAETGVNCDAKTTAAQADFPSGSPWVTSVGGTTLALDEHGDYAWETSMGDELSVLTGAGAARAWGPVPGVFAFGGGGGLGDSPEPWYQHGRVPAPAAGKPARRATPDVSMEGDGALPVLVGLTDAGTFQLVGFGGTSAAAPAFAALQADAQQETGHPLGFANPLLYSLGGTAAFRDVTDQPPAAGPGPLTAVRDYGPSDDETQRYVLYALGRDYGLHASPGYDYATGLGSPSPAYLQRFRRTGGRP